MAKKEKSKAENLPLPAHEAYKKIQDRLADELLDGFQDLTAFLKWKHQLLHACFGNEEAIQKVITILPRFSWPMFTGKEPHQKRYRLDIYNYLMNRVFGRPEAMLFHRAREDPSGQKKGMLKEEVDPFEGMT